MDVIAIKFVYCWKLVNENIFETITPKIMYNEKNNSLYCYFNSS